MGTGKTEAASTKRADPSGNGQRGASPFRLEAPRRRVQIPQLMIAVFLVAVSALVIVILFSRAAARDPILALANPVERGQVVAADDLVVVYVATDDPIASLPIGRCRRAGRFDCRCRPRRGHDRHTRPLHLTQRLSMTATASSDWPSHRGSIQRHCWRRGMRSTLWSRVVRRLSLAPRLATRWSRRLLCSTSPRWARGENDSSHCRCRLEQLPK